MKTGFQVLASALLFTFLVSSCETAKKFTESGDYDSAIDLCVRKLRGKEKKQLEYVQGLEVAFKAQERDLETIAGLNPEKHPWNWETVNEIHLKMRSRQDKVRPLAPLVQKTVMKPNSASLRSVVWKVKVAPKLPNIYTHRHKTWLSKTKGDKLAARKASSMLLELGRRYYRDYRDKTELLKKARDLGTSYVLVEIKNQTGRSLPREFTDRLLAMSKRDLDTEWKEYFLDSRPGEQFDYKAVFKVKEST